MNFRNWSIAEVEAHNARVAGKKNANEPKSRQLDVLAANSGEATVVERGAGNGALAARKAEGPDTGRFLVRVTSRRRRLLDEDNLCEKFAVDCCRYAGLIPGDSPERARIEVRQEKIGKDEPEETVVEIFRLEDIQ